MAGAIKKFKSAKTGKARSAAPPASRENLETYYREMLTIRRFEEKAGQMYGMGLIGGFCHLYIGQEAVVTGVQHALEPGDTVITGYRCHAHMLAAGVDPKFVMAELTGRAAGVSRGKGGSMHMFTPERGFYGGHGIVGAQVPLGAGFGFAHKYRGNDRVSVTYFGDGAANQGQVFEAFNMAALWKLPVIFVIENNQYAMGTSLARSTAIQELYQRGEAFGIPGHQADGMDVLAVQMAAEAAVAKCRAGDGPALLEMMTYRYRGHSMSDPAKYRTREEVSKMRQERDPIENVRERLIAAGYADDEALKEVDRDVKAKINDAAEFSQDSPQPDSAELYTSILATA
ncbi:MAG: pyruvate dehydrogenase (acetyl-transferring) E1 component subunit alpha [Proteobacteria bacterium]|nr:pyruvate dehydrogenase (acetyl-transferring) E1 component subunit alpha [Pseudomonadota bacterium]MDA1355765.1 pyruvate dehydrogenase (acetyl-transferring) E1 component subunit alpha [Pseudomonadota bacterium]